MWYYLEGNEQRGPVEESELLHLAAAGTILPKTQVWTEGMTDWLSYEHARSMVSVWSQPATDILPSNQALCAECRGAFYKADMTTHKNAWVCHLCQPSYALRTADVGEVRRSGLRKMAAGSVAVLGSVLIPVGLYINDPSVARKPPMAFVFAAAALFPLFVVGAIEYFTGKPIGKVSERWDNLRPWQRFLITTTVILVTSVVCILGIGVYFQHFHNKR